MLAPWSLSRFLLGCILSCAASGTHPLSQASIAVPLKVQPLPTRMHGFSKYFSKFVPVVEQSLAGSHGVQVVATSLVPDSKVERVANVLAQFLDNDEDGLLDNPAVVGQLEMHGATMIMFNTFEELEESNFTGIEGYGLQDEEGEETSLQPAPANLLLRAGLILANSSGDEMWCRLNSSVICDATLEEAFHLVTDVGFANAYPHLFGTRTGSALAVTMEHLIGNCGYASMQTPLSTFSSFRWPGCRGLYHYDDATCGYSCLVTEYFHHFIASYNGEYPYGGCRVSPHEWELCVPGDVAASRALLRREAPDAFRLILSPHFRVPLRIPTGSYSYSSPPLLRASRSEMSLPKPSPLVSFRISLPSDLRRAHQRAAQAAQPHNLV